MQRQQLLPGLAKCSKVESYSNIVRAINDIANYSQHKRKLLSRFKGDNAASVANPLETGNGPVNGPVTSRPIKLGQVVSQMSQESTRHRTLSKIDLTVPQVSAKRMPTRLHYETIHGVARREGGELMSLLEHAYDCKRDTFRQVKRRQLNSHSQREHPNLLSYESSNLHPAGREQALRRKYSHQRPKAATAQNIKPFHGSMLLKSL